MTASDHNVDVAGGGGVGLRCRGDPGGEIHADEHTLLPSGVLRDLALGVIRVGSGEWLAFHDIDEEGDGVSFCDLSQRIHCSSDLLSLDLKMGIKLLWKFHVDLPCGGGLERHHCPRRGGKAGPGHMRADEAGRSHGRVGRRHGADGGGGGEGGGEDGEEDGADDGEVDGLSYKVWHG